MKKWELWAALLALVLLAAARGEGGARPAAGEAAVEEERLIALTFDDGPSRATTPALLDGLRDRGAEATFFLIGSQLEGNEDLVARMAAEGHQIGIHTWDHVGLTGAGAGTLEAQVDRERRALARITGGEDFWLRPPYGWTDRALLERVRVPVILWSVDPEDWKRRDAGAVADHLVSHAADGAILLLHDIYPTSVEAALSTVDRLTGQGYRFVTVEELARRRGAAPVPGQVYRSFG